MEPPTRTPLSPIALFFSLKRTSPCLKGFLPPSEKEGRSAPTRKGRSVPTAATWPPRAHRVLDRAHPTFSVAPAPVFAGPPPSADASVPLRCPSAHCPRSDALRLPLPATPQNRQACFWSTLSSPHPNACRRHHCVAGNPDATATTDIVVAAALASRPQRRLHRPPRP